MAGISRSLPGFAALALALCAVAAQADKAAPPPSAALAAYLDRPDPSYAWRVRSSGKVGRHRYVELIMSSQTWRDVEWRHQLYIIDPANRPAGPQQALLYIDGGRWKPEYDAVAASGELPRRADLFVELAEQLRAPVVVLRHVPFQPLFDGLTEDWIIALTFDRYLESGDSEWPLLLPMVKAAVRAMDTAQAFVAAEWDLAIESFTVTGASKRGWTTWLAGAADARVAAIAPMVIDVLNMSQQMQHARATWGQPSHKIQPYTERRLHERLDSPGGRSLLAIVDPYSYREVLRQPKLIINGTNDQYWPLDALNLYWPHLKGDKYVLYVPNNGHDVRDYRRVLGGVVALHRHVAHGAPLPRLEWNFEERASAVRLEVRADMRPRRAVVWVATSPTRDFREAAWRAETMKREGGAYAAVVERPDSGYVAVLGEGLFTRGFRLPFYLSTTVEIFGPPGSSASQP